MSLNQKQSDMRAVRIHEFGGTEVLTLDTIELPDPQADEMLVRVAASSVNPIDFKIRNGTRLHMVGQEDLPFTLGRDFAGTIELCDMPTPLLQVGTEVYGMSALGRGTQAEFVVAKANEVAPKPKTLDMITAAAVPLAALTAWQGLFDHGELQAGQRVLIHGGSGGVGHLAVQFAVNKGAEVVTTVSTANIEFARELGAKQVIDYKSEKFEDVCGKVDLVLDLIGGETQDRSWAVIKPGGALMTATTEPSEEKAKKLKIRTLRFMAKPNARQLAEIAQLIDDGKVKIVVDKIFDLDDIDAAHTLAETGGFRGKLGINVLSS